MIENRYCNCCCWWWWRWRLHSEISLHFVCHFVFSFNLIWLPIIIIVWAHGTFFYGSASFFFDLCFVFTFFFLLSSSFHLTNYYATNRVLLCKGEFYCCDPSPPPYGIYVFPNQPCFLLWVQFRSEYSVSLVYVGVIFVY